MSLDIPVSIFKIDVFCEMAAILAAILNLYSLITNYDRNRLLVCITMRKVVLHDILSQIVQKLGFIIWLWPSWISRLAQEFSLAIRLIVIIEVLMMRLKLCVRGRSSFRCF